MCRIQPDFAIHVLKKYGRIWTADSVQTRCPQMPRARLRTMGAGNFMCRIWLKIAKYDIQLHPQQSGPSFPSVFSKSPLHSSHSHIYGNGRPRLRSLPPLTPLPGTHAGSGVRDELVTKEPVRLSPIIEISIRTVNKERPGYEPRLPEYDYATIGVRQTQSSLASSHI